MTILSDATHLVWSFSGEATDVAMVDWFELGVVLAEAPAIAGWEEARMKEERRGGAMAA